MIKLKDMKFIVLFPALSFGLLIFSPHEKANADYKSSDYNLDYKKFKDEIQNKFSYNVKGNNKAQSIGI